MNDKKKYYSLDDIGVIGNQVKRTASETKEENMMTSKAIKTLKIKMKASKKSTRKVAASK